jgi:Flp pilus assembly pilin Flp
VIRLIAKVRSRLEAACARLVSGTWLPGRSRLQSERGQTTAEYALVILAAAAIALVLLAWARSSGRLPAFFDSIIDRIVGDSQQ